MDWTEMTFVRFYDDRSAFEVRRISVFLRTKFHTGFVVVLVDTEVQSTTDEFPRSRMK